MRLSITFACCLASILLTSNCLATDSTHPVDPLLRGREKDESTAGRRSSRGRRVHQVYFEQRANMDEIEVPSESIPLPVLTSREDGQRELSFWSSILNFIKCPPGFHDDNNPHCHHHHAAKSHSPSTSGGGGGGDGNDDNGNDDNGNDDNGCGDNDDACGCGGGNDDDGCKDRKTDDYATYPPTVYEENISNDHSCWWCGRGQRNNSSQANGSYSNPSAEGSRFSYGAVAIGGTAVAAIAAVLFKKRRDSASTTTSSSKNHLLSGAVGKRKKKVTMLLDESESKASSDPDSSGRGKRRGFLSKIFGKSKGNKVVQAPEETPGSHYVKV